MSEMVKKMVAAMDACEPAIYGMLPELMKEAMARSILVSMRDPTEKMLFVGSNDEAGFTARNLRFSWHLMIDEALR